MASLAGKDVALFIKDSVETLGAWYESVCSLEHSLSLQKSESTVITKCGSETTAGTDDDSVSLTLTFILGTPAAGEITASMLENIYLAGREFEWMIADTYPSPLITSKQGLGVITQLEETFPVEGMVQYAFTIKVNGSITKNL